MSNDSDLGRILGYPKCCVDFFCKRFTADNPNLQLKPTNPFTNLTQREKDRAIISHFPCSSDCQESIELGKLYLEIITRKDSERGKELLECLR